MALIAIMNKILSLLLTCVFLQTQCWALSGGPQYPVDSSAPASYVGSLIAKSKSNSMGVFSIDCPTGTLGEGTFSVFLNGEVVSGTMSGAVVFETQQLTATFDATMKDEVSGTITDTGVTSTTTNTVTNTNTTEATNGTATTQNVTGPTPPGVIVGATGIAPIVVDGIVVTGITNGSVTDSNVVTDTTSVENTAGTTKTDDGITDNTVTKSGFVTGTLTAKIKRAPTSQGPASLKGKASLFIYTSSVTKSVDSNGSDVTATTSPSQSTKIKYTVQGNQQAPAAVKPVTPVTPLANLVNPLGFIRMDVSIFV